MRTLPKPSREAYRVGGPSVSIIINNYNYGRFLRQCIDSALSQTYPHTEVVVVDDGSTDQSLQIIADYGNQIIPVLKGNGGQASAFNAGFAACRGDILFFLDADDLLIPGAVAEVLPLFRRPEVVKVHWPSWAIDENGRRTGALVPGVPLCEGYVGDIAIRNGPLSSAHAPTSGNAWARWFLEEVQPVQECGDKHGADAHLLTVAEIAGVIEKLDTPLGCYRVHSGAFTRRTVEFGLRLFLRRYDHLCRVLHEHLARRGIMVDPAVWKGPNTSYRWKKQLLAITDAVSSLIPIEETFILVDEHQLCTDTIAGRQAFPFLERDGEYWGPPEDDATALRELERLRRQGAGFILFGRPGLWWLDYYTELRRYLHSHFRCLRADDCLVIFDLRSSVRPPLATTG